MPRPLSWTVTTRSSDSTCTIAAPAKRSTSIPLGHRPIVTNGLVQDDAFERIAIVLPGLARERPHGVGVAGLPAAADAGRCEVDILGVVLVVEPRRQEPDHVHAREAAIGAQLLSLLALVGGDQLDQLRHHVTQLVHLALARDVARHPARILDVLVAIEPPPHGLRRAARRVAP